MVGGRGQGGSMGSETYEVKTKREKKLRPFTSPEKEEYLFYIYEVLTLEIL